MIELPLFRDTDPEVLTIHLPGPNFSVLSTSYAENIITIVLINNDKKTSIAVNISGFDDNTHILGTTCDNSDTVQVVLSKSGANEYAPLDMHATYLEYTPVNYKRISALEYVKGKLADGYTAESAMRMGAYLLRETGINIQVIWDYEDFLGCGGDSNIVLSLFTGSTLYKDTVGIGNWLLHGDGSASCILANWDIFLRNRQTRHPGGSRCFNAKKYILEHNWRVLNKDQIPYATDL